MKNPVNWIGGATIAVAGLKTVARNSLTSTAETVAARGITGSTFTESQLSSMLRSSSAEDMITLYRGGAANEGSGALYLTEDITYAEAYAKQKGGTVSTYQVSRSGYNRLKNEGLINASSNNSGVLVDAKGKTIAKGQEVEINNQSIKNIFIKSKKN
jgi:hypothetical protein